MYICRYVYIYIDIYILAWDLCIYMHRESESDVKVDPIVKLIWSKVCITIYITISITNLTTIVAQVWSGSYRGRTQHYPRSGQQGGKVRQVSQVEGGPPSQPSQAANGGNMRKTLHVASWESTWMSSGLCLAPEGLSLKKIPSWEEPLQKSQFLTENSFKRSMSHFRPTSRGEDLGEHLDVFRWQAIVEGVLQVIQFIQFAFISTSQL